MAMVAWKETTRYIGLRWQLADVLRTVTHRTSGNLCGYCQGAAERIEAQVWTESPTRTDNSTMALSTIPPASY